jgi:hypothetical protein
MTAIAVASEPGVKLSSRAYASFKWWCRASAPPIATSTVAIRNGRFTSTPVIWDVGVFLASQSSSVARTTSPVASAASPGRREGPHTSLTRVSEAPAFHYCRSDTAMSNWSPTVRTRAISIALVFRLYPALRTAMTLVPTSMPAWAHTPSYRRIGRTCRRQRMATGSFSFRPTSAPALPFLPESTFRRTTTDPRYPPSPQTASNRPTRNAAKIGLSLPV